MIIGDRHHRFEKAINYLVSLKMIDGTNVIKDVSGKMNRFPGNVREALKGSDKYLTEKFVRKFCMIFGGVISPDWILSGTGEMLNETQSCTNFNDINNSSLRISKELLMKLTKEQIVEILYNVIEQHHQLCEKILNSSKDITMQVIDMCKSANA